MAWDTWLGMTLTDREELLKRGYLMTRPVTIDTTRARLALNKSAPRFLAYGAFARYARRNKSLLSQRSFLIVLRVPKIWEASELVLMAKLILRNNPEIMIAQHPAKGKRGHEFDAQEALLFARIILFVHDDVELHPDVEAAASVIEDLEVTRRASGWDYTPLSREEHLGELSAAMQLDRNHAKSSGPQHRA
jgi:hypothetical protein